MTAPKFGVIYSRLHPLIDPGEFAARVEELKFSSVWVTEGLANQKAALDPMVTMAAFAARTKTITIGSCVIIAPLRTPALLAKTAASLDILSKGRLILGIGVGGSSLSNSADFAACGIDPAERGARCDEMLELIKAFWSGEPVRYDGRYYQVDGVRINPTPVQQPYPPLWAGGEADGVLRRTARQCTGFVPMGKGPQHYQQLWDRVRTYADEYGTDWSTIQRAVHLYYCSGPDQASAHAQVERTLSDRYGFEVSLPDDGSFLAGTPSDCLQTIERYRLAGVEHFVVNTARPIEEVTQDIEQFATNILPHFA